MEDYFKISGSPAKIRANRNWVKRLKAQGLCARGCGTKVEGRVYCKECTYKSNHKYSYKTKIQRRSEEIRRLRKIIELQHTVIAHLREELRAHGLASRVAGSRQ